jgi:hypothetical protein
VAILERPKEISMKLPYDPRIQEAYANLLLEDRMVFEHTYAVQSRGLPATYLTWLVGSHYVYLGRKNVQIAYWFTAGGLLLWAMADLIRIPGLVNEYNRAVALNALEPLAQRSKTVEANARRQLEPNAIKSSSSTQVVDAADTVVLEPVPSSQHAVIEFVF